MAQESWLLPGNVSPSGGPVQTVRNFRGTILRNFNFVTLEELTGLRSGDLLDLQHVVGTSQIRWGGAWSTPPFVEGFEGTDPTIGGTLADGELDGQVSWVVTNANSAVKWMVSTTGAIADRISALFDPASANTGNTSSAVKTATDIGGTALSIAPATKQFSMKGKFKLESTAAGDGTRLTIDALDAGNDHAFRLIMEQDAATTGQVQIVHNGGTATVAAIFTMGDTYAFHVSGDGNNIFRVFLRNVSTNAAWAQIGDAAGYTFVAAGTPITQVRFIAEVLDSAVLGSAQVDDLELGTVNLPGSGILIFDGTGIMKEAVDGTRLLPLRDLAVAVNSGVAGDATIELVVEGS